MKVFFFFIFTFLLLSCVNNSNKADEKLSEENEVIETTSKDENLSVKKTWIESLRGFRDAVYQDDLEKIKTYFDFPIQSKQNKLWLFPKMNGEEEYPDLEAPFTEKNFEGNYKNIFSKEFIKALLKVKTKILFEKHAFETDFIQSGTKKVKMQTKYNQVSNTLSLTFYSEEPIYDGKTQELIDTAEFTINYTFTFDSNSRMKFFSVLMAG